MKLLSRIVKLVVNPSSLDLSKARIKCRRMLTELLKKAFEEAAKLPEFEQNAWAEAMLAAIAGDALWDGVLEQTQDKLERLANRVLSDDTARGLEPLVPDKL